jgi:phage shock protein A
MFLNGATASPHSFAKFLAREEESKRRRGQMSDDLTELRKQAADALRAARRSKSPLDRLFHESKARGYRLLAENEAWLTGKIRTPKEPKQPSDAK